ncbi:DMT family transporter [Photobacterium leiognathi]|uniref:DMT family transporter n=1 Tax=Photobacterium leiognathi TaxID=553611 RepID=UPI00273A096A|nr:DMT family transporter [Photobacterium leiognathi]
MSLYILLGLINGICIALSRIVNGQLSSKRGAFYASYINHIVGFLFLSLLMLLWVKPSIEYPTDITLYSGGLIGALYVAINSVVMTKLGSTNAIVLVIGGQMLFSVLLDAFSTDLFNLTQQAVGVILIITGVAIKETLAVRMS